MVDYKEFIEIDSEIRFGKPVVKGIRIIVFDVLGWLAAGLTHQDIITDFPQINEVAIYV